MGTQRAGGVAAIALGGVIVIELATFLVYAPSLGVNVGELGDPTKLLDLLIRGRIAFAVTGTAFAAACIFALVLVRALDQRLREGAPQLSATAALFGYTAFVLLAVDFQARAAFALAATNQLTREAAIQAGPAVLIVQRAVTDTFALGAAAYFGLLAIASLRIGVMPRVLGGVEWIVAAAALVGIFVAIDPVPQLLLMVWSFWIGAILLTTPAQRWATSATRPSPAT